MELTPTLAAAALDGLWSRQAATAQNIANAGADNYVPVRVTFEDALRDAWASARLDPASGPEAIATAAPRVIEDTSVGIGTVRLDHEIAVASETSARYAMLTGMLSRTLEWRELATKGG
jgi:flagellar basal-body rod protein FlgB